jgi:hypothetical protein
VVLLGPEPLLEPVGPVLVLVPTLILVWELELVPEPWPVLVGDAVREFGSFPRISDLEVWGRQQGFVPSVFVVCRHHYHFIST